MKILVVAGWMHPDAEGGSFRVVYESGRGLAARGHEVHVLTQRTRPSLPTIERLAGMTVHRYPVWSGSGLGFYVSSLRGVRRTAADLHRDVAFEVVHTHHPVSAYAVATSRALHDVPLVAVVHSLYHLEYLDRKGYDPVSGRMGRVGPLGMLVARGLKRLDRVVLARAGRVVVLSEFMRGLVGEHHGGAGGKVFVAPGGADLSEFRPEPGKAEARAALGLPGDKSIFFCCRRLEPRMGLGELLEAARLLRESGRRDVLVVIAGRGSLGDELARLVTARRLPDAVRSVGYVAESELRLYYRAADCVVMPTRALEGFGLVTAEAFACGRPVLGTPVGATAELLGPFDSRLLTEGTSPEALAAGMGRFLDEVSGDPGLEARCRAYAEKRFSWGRFVDCLERHSRELVEG